MKKRDQRFHFSTIVFVLLFAIFGNSVFVHLWSKSDVGSRHIFESDYDQMKTVAEYLISLDHLSDILIENPSGVMTVGIRKTETITDPKIRKAIFVLFAKGYDCIEKNKGKTIVFERWYDLFERYRGYAFSIDGSTELAIEFVTETKDMTKENWYYYLSDYNEWRSSKQ